MLSPCSSSFHSCLRAKPWRASLTSRPPMVIARPSRRPPQIGKQMGAWPDQTAGSPCHRYSRPLAAIEVNDPPAVVNATRIKPLSRTNSIGAFPFLRQPAKSIGLIENRPAPPHRNASRQLKSCRMPGTAKTKHTSSASKRVIGATCHTRTLRNNSGNPTGHSDISEKPAGEARCREARRH